jgi:drug/metabolite transporter (DMT)-like permease
VLVGFYRLVFAGAMLSLPVVFLKPRDEKVLPGGNGLKWGILGGLVLALNLGLWCSALNYTTASAVTLLDNTAPVWVGLLSWMLFKERQPGRFWLRLLVALGGAGLMIGWDVIYGASVQTTGNLIGVASGISYAVYVLITKKRAGICPACAIPGWKRSAARLECCWLRLPPVYSSSRCRVKAC